MFKNPISININRTNFQMKIVITGASSGMGKVIGEFLVSKGHHVLGTGRYKEGHFRNLQLVKLDVTNDESVTHFTQTVLQHFNKIDVLIN